MLLPNQKLLSFNIIEREISKKNLITWSYPCIANDVKQLLLSKCFTLIQADGVFYCIRKKRNWIYVKQQNNERKFAIALITEDYDVIKYKLLCDVLFNHYEKNGNPVVLVKEYLRLFTGGCCSYQENGSHISCDLKNYEKATKVKDLINDFGLEVILIYTAILLKRRVLVYHNEVEKLQLGMLAMTGLAPNRNLNDYLHPLVENFSLELKGLSFYVAGTNNKNVLGKETLWDIFVNLPSKEITISSQSKDTFAMTKTHKDVATLLVKLAESDLPESKVIEEIGNKTKTILSQLKSLASFTNENNLKMLTLNDLKTNNFNSKMENFLFNLAMAEGIMIL